MLEKDNKLTDLISMRIDYSLTQLGSRVQFWEEANIEQAWRLVANSYSGWDKYLENRSDLPGGLIERPVNAGGKTIGWAFIGLKTLDRPKGWRYGVIGFNGALMSLGNFPNKIK